MTPSLPSGAADSTASNINDHLGQPAVAGLLYLQSMIRDRLDFVFQSVPAAVEPLAPCRAVQRAVRDLHLELAEQQVLHVEMIQQLLEPIEEEIVALLGLDVHLDAALRLNRAQGFDDGREQGLGGFHEKRAEVRGADAQAQVGGVLESLVHDLIRRRRAGIYDTLTASVCGLSRSS